MINKKELSLKLDLYCKEKIIGNIYYEEEESLKDFIKNYQIGDYVLIKGKLKVPSNNTIPNLFNYKRYLYNNRIYYLLEIDDIKLISRSKDPFIKIKNYILSQINNYSKTSSYLKAFILGDTSDISDRVKSSYQMNGISHLLAVSGMQISCFAGAILLVLKKLRITEKKRYFFALLFVLFYLFLTNSAPSILRASIFFFLLTINKIYYFYIKTLNLFILTIVIALFINPFLIYNIGFLYSFIISFYLILYSKYLNSKNYLISLIKVSLISFLVSMPITIYNNFNINILSFIYNLFYVPFVNIIIFPLSLIVLLLPFLNNLFKITIDILETSSIYLSNISFTKIILSKVSIPVIIFYYIIITIIIFFITKRKYYGIVLLLITLFIHQHSNFFMSKNYLIMIDFGQGDSILLHSNNKTFLLDTGGNYNYHITEKTISLMMSLGIQKIDYLFLTHGDYDHMGDSIYLINNFKVGSVYLNDNKFNDLELSLIKLLTNKNIKYSKLKEEVIIRIGNVIIYSLNGDLIDENDSSLVLLLKIFEYNLLLMGDASIKTENRLINKYKLPNIDILKIGHHGSNTSTSKELLDVIRPRVALISVGLNNLYHHPSQRVINRLNDYQTEKYLTSKAGSIKINFKSGTISNYSP